MGNILKSLINFGTHQTDDYKLKRNIRFLNICTGLGIINIFIYLIKNIFINRYDAVFFESIFFVAMLLTFYINKINHKLSFLSSILLMETFFLLLSLYLFPGEQVELFFLFMAIVPHIFFYNTKWSVIIFFINLILYFTPQLIYHPYRDENFNYMVPITVFTVTFFLVRFFRLQVESYESILTKLNKKLLNDKLLIESHANQLELLDIEKTTFFTNVSHEFKTPLTLIVGWSKEILENPNREDNNNIINLIKNNANKLAYMVNDILELAKTGNANYSILRSPVLIKKFLNKHLEIFNFYAKKNNIEIVLDISPDDLILYIDENKFDQVYNNLIFNAIKFSPNGGIITLKAHLKVNFIELIVQDQGLGINQDNLNAIFDRFFSSESSNNIKGTGIGLNYTKELIELHEGTIRGELAKPTGLAIIIELPLSNSLNEAVVNDEIFITTPYTSYKNKNNIKKNKHILLVEDNEDMNYYISQILEQDDYTVYHTIGAFEALEILKQTKIDLIITDYMMPGMDGYNFCKKLKSNISYQSIPIIFVTAKNDFNDKIKVLELGINDYISKPFNKKELLIRINNLFNRNVSKHQFISCLPSNEKDSSDANFMKQINTLIENKITQKKLTLIDISTELNITERTLHRKVKALTGLTPLEYINELKLQYAYTLLENKTYPTLKQVAYDIGIDTVHYFCKMFEKRFGKHPSEF